MNNILKLSVIEIIWKLQTTFLIIIHIYFNIDGEIEIEQCWVQQLNEYKNIHI